jgi:hypothetical protein
MLFKIAHIALRPEVRNSQIFYCANFKLIYTRLLLLLIGSRNFQKFDDGIGELLENSWFSKRESTLVRWFFILCSPRLTYKNFEVIDRAFTIYPQLCVGNTKLISLLDTSDSVLSKTQEAKTPCTVLIGQCYSSSTGPLTPHLELELISKTIQEYSVDVFIPHPLSNLNSVDLAVDVVEPNVVAEEYVAQLFKKGPLRVLGFRTSAVFNLRESMSGFVKAGDMELVNLTVYLDGRPLSPEWVDDIWSRSFRHTPIHISSSI